MRILFTVTDDWYFLSHRRVLALGLLKAGHSVSVMAGRTGEATWNDLVELGVDARPIEFDRTVKGQFRNFLRIREIAKAIESSGAEIVHNISFIPQFFGARASRKIAGVKVVNAVTGLGHAFSGRGVRHTLMRRMVEAGYRDAMASRDTRAIFQNKDDLELFVSRSICTRSQACYIGGSGVDTVRFTPNEKDVGGVGPPVILHASRMLKTKGVYESLDASRDLERRGVPHCMILAGATHPDNPASFTVDELGRYRDGNIRKWIGHCDDMPHLFRQARVVVLPTRYREGVPLVLLEAAASGLPIVTTDMPGCRDIVQDDVNGIIVPPGDSRALADALDRLLRDPELRKRMGSASRRLACTQYSATAVVAKTIGLYESMLST